MKRKIKFLLVAMIVSLHLFAQIKLAIQQTGSAPNKMKISLSFTTGPGTNYSGQTMVGYFFILKTPTSCGDVILSNFVGYSGQSNGIVFINRSTAGAFKYAMYELNVAGIAPSTWVYPNTPDLVSFDINLANGCSVELAPDGDPNADALIDGHLGGGTSGFVYGCDINMNGNPTVIDYTIPLVILPVVISNYDIRCNDKGVLLMWSTSSEQNSDRFEIQRSKNSLDWDVIDNVAATGNSDVQRNYQYLDLNGGGLFFYRIRPVDKDGRFVYTAIKQTNCKTARFNITLFPVPATDKLKVVIRSENAIKTDLQIMDISGRIVSRITTQILKGNNNIILNVSKLPAGQYVLASSNPELIIDKKFTVIR